MTSILKLAKLLISELSPTSSYTISNQYRLGDIRHNFADLTKIKKLLDFDPKINFETGISFYCDWVRKQEYIQGNYEQSILELKSRGLLKS
jgi:dTDP-L-rhamnose 4-epimerase